MEHRFDHLMLANGGKFAVPFDLVLVFSSNLRPAELADTAFLRRLGHKIEVGALAFDDYMTLFERACHDAGVGIDGATASEVLRECHARDARPMLASYPRDLVALVASRAAYLEVDATMSAELIGWAWHCYFGDDESTNEAGPLVVTGATPDTNTHRSTR